jgi:hypothetical protein
MYWLERSLELVRLGCAIKPIVGYKEKNKPFKRMMVK